MASEYQAGQLLGINLWRFYTDLNRIRVAEFETELKDYGYSMLRAAIRANDMVEYIPESQPHSVLDLAIEGAYSPYASPTDNTGFHADRHV